MSSAIIKFEDDPNKLIYWKDHSYPTGLGFKLVSYYNDESNDLYEDTSLYEIVTEIPHDIQYEYIVKSDHSIHCQESWFTPDKNYHGGGFRHGGIYDLVELKKKVELQKKYTTRRPEDWNGNPRKKITWKFNIKLFNKFDQKFYSSIERKETDKRCKQSNTTEYETTDIDVCREIINDFLDVVENHEEIDANWVIKNFNDVEMTKVDSIIRYYNGRLELYNKIISDIDKYLSIDNDCRRNTVYHYDIPYDMNHFSIGTEFDKDDIQEDAYIEVKIDV